MHLTRALLFYVKKHRIPGLVDAGKHQLVKPVTVQMKRAAVQQLLLEYENQKLLQNPFITEEEEEGHMEASGRLAQIKAEQKDKRITERMFEHYTMAEHLEHLNVTKSWE
jgi:hypothetical protein